MLPLYGRFETAWASGTGYGNPLQDATLRVIFTAPSGRTVPVDGFWDGGNAWRVRFLADEPGEWAYQTDCSDAANADLHGRTGAFTVSDEPAEDNALTRHGPVRVASEGTHLAHADGTPFLWLADTAWYGPMLAGDAEWREYAARRADQGFTAVQWIAAPWYCCRGDRKGRAAYTGRTRIAVDPYFFQNLDAKLDALNDAGLLGAAAMLWVTCYFAPDVDPFNPGVSLPEDQAILLARYMRARWGAHHVAWLLCGDGPYGGQYAERWRTIGRSVFGDTTGRPDAPVVMLHPFGGDWPHDDYSGETWLNVTGYQSGHAADDAAASWLTAGPPATKWRESPTRPLLNLEPPYEDHLTRGGGRLDGFLVRRALWWSLLGTPTAGVSYGAHGVWSWEDGGTEPFGHNGAGTTKSWRDALDLEAGTQFAHLRAFLETVQWNELRPAPERLAEQPGDVSPQRHIAVSATSDGAVVVAYTPAGDAVRLREVGGIGEWFDPRTGERHPAATEPTEQSETVWAAPDANDWLLTVRYSG